MKDVFLIYDNCCFYEIVTLSYFLRYSGCDREVILELLGRAEGAWHLH